MPTDGVVKMPYRDFLAVMEGLSVTEAIGEPADAAQELGCRVLVRHALGAGGGSATIRVETEDATIYPAEIRHALKLLGMSVQSFVDAASETLRRR